MARLSRLWIEEGGHGGDEGKKRVRIGITHPGRGGGTAARQAAWSSGEGGGGRRGCGRAAQRRGVRLPVASREREGTGAGLGTDLHLHVHSGLGPGGEFGGQGRGRSSPTRPRPAPSSSGVERCMWTWSLEEEEDRICISRHAFPSRHGLPGVVVATRAVPSPLASRAAIDPPPPLGLLGPSRCSRLTPLLIHRWRRRR
uniref:Uncharacterized protein n=1 Tax=Oryza sativa subsp. japonica TaxID=39947 RepID=Q65XQ4_ORYSJ|nr:hypothetical protein [Oryza sativa Japonica Group]AAV32211.1 hypothetical protein [Oryza sativa Japonica Group]